MPYEAIAKIRLNIIRILIEFFLSLIFATKKESDFLALSGYMIFNFPLSQNSRHLGLFFILNENQRAN